MQDLATVVEPSPISRNKVEEIEQMMLKMPQVQMELRHHFSDGIYARELHIPKGTTVTGKIHKYTNLNILAKGDISVLIDGQIKRVQAPFTVVSPPGTKRIVFAHEDCVWITMHATEETDLEKIEHHFTAGSDKEYLAFCETLQLEGK